VAVVDTAKQINPYQLTQELGSGVRVADLGELTRVKAPDATQPALEAAVAAHVANPAVVPPPDQPLVNRGIVEQRMDDALAQLQTIINYPTVAQVPNGGTLTAATLSTVVRALREAVHENRVGIQRVAATLRDTIRLVRGDFDDID
jgi:hypothetical protein